MVQVDVVWAYGLGAGLALAASKNLENEATFWQNKYFKLSMLWIGLIFAPCGLYLLSEFPAWETMFVVKDPVPAWLIGLFGLTNLALGALGFAVTYGFIKKGRTGLARLQTIWAHSAMMFIILFGWDGTGYRRFVYVGSGEDWQNSVPYPAGAFVGSPVFWALTVMSLFFFPTYFGLVSHFRKAPEQASVASAAASS